MNLAGLVLVVLGGGAAMITGCFLIWLTLSWSAIGAISLWRRRHPADLATPPDQ